MASKKQQPEPELTFERKGSPYRHFDFWVENERINGSTKKLVADIAGAEAVARALRNRALDEAAARRVAPPPVRDEKDMTWDEAVASYLEFRGNYASASGDLRNLARLKTRIGSLSVTRIGDAKLSELVAERRQEHRYGRPHLPKVSNDVVNNSVTFLIQRILMHAQRQGVRLHQPPYWRLHILPVKPRQREMVIDEEMILEDRRPDVWPFYQFVLETGLRRSPALIQKSQVHWRQGFITVTGKGNKPQNVEITPEVAAILRSQWNKHPVWVFTYQARRNLTHRWTNKRQLKGEYVPLTYNNVRIFWKLICKEAEVTNLRIHDIRKTTGARIVRSTGDIKAAAHVLNHASIKQTDDAYSYITSNDVRRRLAQTAAETRRLRSGWVPGTDDGPNSTPAD